MIEVAEHDKDSSSFGAEGVLNRHFGIVEGDESGTGSRRLHEVDKAGRKITNQDSHS